MRIQLGDRIDQRQRRDRRQLPDAEMPAHGCNGCRLRAGRLQPTDQLREDGRLRLRIARVHVAGHLAHFGVGDGQLQLAARGGERAHEATVVELRGRGPDAADQADMHERPLCKPFSDLDGVERRALEQLVAGDEQRQRMARSDRRCPRAGGRPARRSGRWTSTGIGKWFFARSSTSFTPGALETSSRAFSTESLVGELRRDRHRSGRAAPARARRSRQRAGRAGP